MTNLKLDHLMKVYFVDLPQLLKSCYIKYFVCQHVYIRLYEKSCIIAIIAYNNIKYNVLP